MWVQTTASASGRKGAPLPSNALMTPARAALTATMLSLLSVSATALQFFSPPQPHLTAPRTNIAEVRILPTINEAHLHKESSEVFNNNIGHLLTVGYVHVIL